MESDRKDDPGQELLEGNRIATIPQSIYYFPNFLSQHEEASLLQKIPPHNWLSLTRRRLQALPARLTANNVLLASPLPAWLTDPLVHRIRHLGVFKDAPHGINHCLINEYLPGQGIMPHEDGGAYYPVVATVSLGGSIVLDLTPKREMDGLSGSAPLNAPPDKSSRILQESRSLLLTTGSAYTDTLHGIAELYEDVDLTADTVANWDLLGHAAAFSSNDGRNERSTRISLTFRDVKKVSNIGSKVFGRPKS